MAHVRERIRMTDEEVARHLDECPHVQIATINADGSPHLMTMRFAAVDGDIVFHTYGKSQKIRNLERDSRIAVLAEAGHAYDELRGASINGSATLVGDPHEALALVLAVRARYEPDRPADELEASSRRLLEKRVVVRVRPERSVTWDHRKLAVLGRTY